MINCLYRDFFIFLKMMNLEKNKWNAFKQYYFEKHRDFLSTVWFSFQGYTPKNIRERVTRVKREDYAQVEGELKVYDIEENTNEVIVHCKRLLGSPQACDIYLFIGFFSPDAFVIPFRDKNVICVGLERFKNFTHYPILLSHEFCHFIMNWRNSETGKDEMGRMIREGISVYFSKLAYPGKKDHVYLFMKENIYRFLQEHYTEILESIIKRGVKDQDIFHGQSDEYPPRTGYYIGYRIVKDFIQKTGKSDIEFLFDQYRSILMDFTGV